MKKDPDTKKISVVSKLPPGSIVIIVEDVSTKRTAVLEAWERFNEIPGVEVASYILTVIDRASSDENNYFPDGKPMTVKSLTKVVADEYDPKSDEGCFLCHGGSEAMKPKDPVGNWKKYFLKEE